MWVRLVKNFDIPKWWALSREYDCYVKELVPDLSEWYDGNNDTSISFDAYIESKINKQEAFIAEDDINDCLGIIAISRANNRISFFGVSHRAGIHTAGSKLIKHALENLDDKKPVNINEINSTSPQIQKQIGLLLDFGFEYSCDATENGVPVNVFVKPPLSKE